MMIYVTYIMFHRWFLFFINTVVTYVTNYVSQVVSPAVCEGILVSTSLPGASGVSGVTHAGYWLPMLQTQLH